MAFHGTKTAVAGVWVELTNAEDVTGSIRVQNVGAFEISLQATSGATAPTSEAGGLTLGLRETFDGTLATWFPGVSGAVRLWAIGVMGVSASVSYE